MRRYLLINLLLLIAQVSYIHAQTESGLGWIEGVLITDSGKPAASFCAGTCNGGDLMLLSPSGKKINTENDIELGGFYTFRNLRPGVYELFVKDSVQYVQGELISYRPQHIFGIVVEPNKRLRLNLTVREGKALEEIGEPALITQDVVLVADELRRLQKEINSLRESLAGN